VSTLHRIVFASFSAAFMGALQHSIELHTPAWKAAYEAGRVAQAPAVK
jgi:hypothetical protein